MYRQQKLIIVILKVAGIERLVVLRNGDEVVYIVASVLGLDTFQQHFDALQTLDFIQQYHSILFPLLDDLGITIRGSMFDVVIGECRKPCSFNVLADDCDMICRVLNNWFERRHVELKLTIRMLRNCQMDSELGFFPSFADTEATEDMVQEVGFDADSQNLSDMVD